MKIYDHLVHQLQDTFSRIESQMELISNIDRKILTLDSSLDDILNEICDKIKLALNVNNVVVAIPVEDKFLPVKNDPKTQQLISLVSKKITEYRWGKDNQYFIIEDGLPEQINLLCVFQVYVSKKLFGLLLITCDSKHEQQELLLDSLEFCQMITMQLGIMIERFLEQKWSRHNSELVQLFFNNKLKPSTCWNQIVENIYNFLPNWQPLLINPPPKVQLLSYNDSMKDTKRDKYLRIIATQGNEMIGTEVLVDSSICGLLIQDRSLNYICVNPNGYPDRYKGFLLDNKNNIPQSELAVSIKYEDKIIGILNMEHPEPLVFYPQHIKAILSSCRFIAPFLSALRERYERQRSKEIGILYTISNLLTRLASTYQHLLGQPLIDIRFTMEDLEEELSNKSAEGIKMLRDIATQVDRISESSDRFCETLPRFIQKGWVNVANAIKNALSVFNLPKIEKEDNIYFDIDIPDDVVDVYASELLQEHIYNIINNSIYSVRRAVATDSNKKGEIKIHLKKQKLQTMLNQDTATSLVRFYIADNGLGAPKEIEKKIGTPGFTSKGDYGTGFGLSAATEYVQFFLGNLEWENFPNKGFLVKFYLEEYNDKKHSDNIKGE